MGAFTSGLLKIGSLASTGLQVAGQLQQGQRTQEAQDYNAAIAGQESQAFKQQIPIIEHEQKLLKERAELDKLQLIRKKSLLRGEQVARYGKAGVTLSGSAMEVIIDSAAQFELDLMLTDYNLKQDIYSFELEKWGANVNAAKADSQAEYDRAIGRQARSESYFKAGRTMLTSAVDWYEKYGKSGKAIPTYGSTPGSTYSKAPANYYLQGKSN